MILDPPDAPDKKRTPPLSSSAIIGLMLDCGLFPGAVTTSKLIYYLLKYETLLPVCIRNFRGREG